MIWGEFIKLRNKEANDVLSGGPKRIGMVDRAEMTVEVGEKVLSRIG